MGYEISDLSIEAQKKFKKVSFAKKSLDINHNNYVDDSEVFSLLEAMGKKNISEILAVNGRGKVSVNSKNNKFLKDYIIAKAEQQGIEIPNEVEIKISSPDKPSDEYITLLNYVRQNIYGARVNDMFNLLNKEKVEVEQKVKGMKISEEDKDKILKLKEIYDEYYQIELEFQNKEINVLSSDKKKLQELDVVSTDFANFIIKEKENLKKVAQKFTQGETEAVVLAEAAESSKNFVPTLLSILALSAGYGITKSVYDSHCEKKNLAEFMQNVKETSRKKIKFVKTIK